MVALATSGADQRPVPLPTPGVPVEVPVSVTEIRMPMLVLHGERDYRVLAFLDQHVLGKDWTRPSLL